MVWSYSAHNCFNRCKRQYYYDHIAAHHNAKDPMRKEAHYLNQLTPSLFWSGKLVEAAIEDVLINRHPNSANVADELYQYSVALGKTQMNFSLSNQFRSVSKSKIGQRKYFRLFEHEYGLEDSYLLQSTMDDVLICCQNFPTMEIPEFSMSLNDLLGLEGLKRCQLPVPLSIFDNSVQCYLDFLSLYQSKVVIIDWKVSKTAASYFADQLRIYGLAIYRSGWARNKELSDIYIYEANLYKGQITRYPLNETIISETEDFIFDSVKRIQRLVNGENFKGLDIENFPQCENYQVCSVCNFRKFCLQERYLYEVQ